MGATNSNSKWDALDGFGIGDREEEAKAKKARYVKEMRLLELEENSAYLRETNRIRDDIK